VLSLLVKHDRHHFVERLEFSEGYFSDFIGLINTLKKLSELRTLNLYDVCSDGYYDDTLARSI